MLPAIVSLRRVATLTVAGVLVLVATPAPAQFATLPVSQCNAGKIKAVGKTTAALLGCHDKDAATVGACLAKVDGKFDAPVPGKGPFDKADAKNRGCVAGTTGNQASYRSKLDGFASGIAVLLGIPATPTKCDAARLRCIGKYVAGSLGCVAKTGRKLGGSVDSVCLAKHATRFSDPMKPGCWDKADDACSNGTTAAAAKAVADVFVAGAACDLFPGATPCPPVCGNAFLEPGEPCDASAAPDVALCGADFPCTACTCACPTRLTLTPDATAVESVVDLGWTGFGHRMPITTNGALTIDVACGGTTRPCGTCTLSGPTTNDGGELANRRCTGDPRVACTSAAECLGVGGTCEFFLGTYLPLVIGGLPLCVGNQVNGGVTGTVDVESGALATAMSVVQSIYNGDAIDTPCPRCLGDATANDGVAGGTCSGGSHDGASCDANGSTPTRPDFGSVSLDCPPTAGNLVVALPIDRSMTTDVVTKTVSPNGPVCRGQTHASTLPGGTKCLCDTCNNANAEPCSDHADCPDPPGPIGPLCGGRRCLGGPNDGAACSDGFSNSECPGGHCDRPGAATVPSGCYIDDCVQPPGVDVGCVDTAPIDGEGECDGGEPFIPLAFCSTASGHAQRPCWNDDDCGGADGSCVPQARRCFLTGPFTPYPNGQGTGTLVAVGMADAPTADSFTPTLARVACVGATRASMVDVGTGLPGPVRETMRVHATFHP